MQKRFNASAVYMDLRYRSPSSLIKTQTSLTCNGHDSSIYHFMISLTFSFQCQTILLGENSNRAIVSMVHIGSVLISQRTRLMQTPGFQQHRSEGMGSWMRVPAQAALRFCFPSVLLFLGVFSSNTLVTHGCCWAAGSAGARQWMLRHMPTASSGICTSGMGFS